MEKKLRGKNWLLWIADADRDEKFNVVAMMAVTSWTELVKIYNTARHLANEPEALRRPWGTVGEERWRQLTGSVYVVVNAYRDCTDDGSWWRSPQNRTWSNYTACVNIAELSVSKRTNFTL